MNNLKHDHFLYRYKPLSRIISRSVSVSYCDIFLPLLSAGCLDNFGGIGRLRSSKQTHLDQTRFNDMVAIVVWLASLDMCIFSSEIFVSKVDHYVKYNY